MVITHPARYMLRRVQQVMMVVPIDPHVNEAQHIAEENRKQWLQGRKTRSLRRRHFQHHDGDDDGKYPITKSFHAALGHTFSSNVTRAARCRRPSLASIGNPAGALTIE